MGLAQDVKRIAQLANALAKEGLGWIVQELELKLHLPITKRFLWFEIPESAKGPERFRRVLEQLGGAFVKLGQFLSLRPDLIPRTYCEELAKLQDRVTPFSFEKVRGIIQAELGKPIEQLFKKFEHEPIGSASIAQVHRAILPDGKAVVVKVQRPDVEKVFEADIELMHHIAARMAKSPRFAPLNPQEIVKEFERYTKRELNFIIEGRNVERFYTAFERTKEIIIPKVFWERTTKRVITLELLEGKPLSRFEGSPAEKKRIAKMLVSGLIKQVFDSDIFHADLHPGNILVLPKGRIAIVDFGIVGSLDPELKRYSTQLWFALLERDAGKIVDILTKVGSPSKETRIDELKQEVREVISEWHGTALRQVRFTHMLRELMDSAIRNKIKPPTELILFAKALMTAEGTALQLYPEFDFVKETRPYLDALLKSRVKEKLSSRYLFKRATEVDDFIEEFSKGLNTLVQKIKRGTIEIEMSHPDVKHVGLDIAKSSNRISYALVISSLVLSSALLVNIGPMYRGVSIFAIAGFSGALLFTALMIFSMLKEGHPKYDPHGS
ncbi:MAG: AarF/UbiB family protein [Candidatus Woesearchaeota archaeon]